MVSPYLCAAKGTEIQRKRGQRNGSLCNRDTDRDRDVYGGNAGAVCGLVREKASGG